VGWVFAANGFGLASWISRLPAIRDEAHLTPARLGFVLLAMSVGALIALPLSGAVVHRWGTRKTVASAALFTQIGLTGLGLAPVVPALVVSLWVFGVFNALWDVAMNVEGASVERALDRPLMPRFHAAFSFGTVIGAAVGAAAAWADVPVRIHLPVSAGIGLLVAGVAVRSFHPDVTGPGPEVRRSSSGVLAAWREPHVLMIGVGVFAAAFCEGAANDWLAVAVVDGYHVSHAVGAMALGVFVAAMTTARLVGPGALARFGRVRVLVIGAFLVAVGVVLLVIGAVVGRAGGLGATIGIILAVVGTVSWGLGAALGFPIGMSAAADDADRAAVRVGVVSSLGYTAFLAGPPLLGQLGDRIGTLPAQLGVLVAAAMMILVAPAARPATALPVPRDG
jgi:MFS family permease